MQNYSNKSIQQEVSAVSQGRLEQLLGNGSLWKKRIVIFNIKQAIIIVGVFEDDFEAIKISEINERDTYLFLP